MVALRHSSFRELLKAEQAKSLKSIGLESISRVSSPRHVTPSGMAYTLLAAQEY